MTTRSKRKTLYFCGAHAGGVAGGLAGAGFSAAGFAFSYYLLSHYVAAADTTGVIVSVLIAVGALIFASAALTVLWPWRLHLTASGTWRLRRFRQTETLAPGADLRLDYERADAHERKLSSFALRVGTLSIANRLRYNSARRLAKKLAVTIGATLYDQMEKGACFVHPGPQPYANPSLSLKPARALSRRRAVGVGLFGSLLVAFGAWAAWNVPGMSPPSHPRQRLLVYELPRRALGEYWWLPLAAVAVGLALFGASLLIDVLDDRFGRWHAKVDEQRFSLTWRLLFFRRQWRVPRADVELFRGGEVLGVAGGSSLLRRTHGLMLRTSKFSRAFALGHPPERLAGWARQLAEMTGRPPAARPAGARRDDAVPESRDRDLASTIASRAKKLEAAVRARWGVAGESPRDTLRRLESTGQTALDVSGLCECLDFADMVRYGGANADQATLEEYAVRLDEFLKARELRGR